MYYVLKPILSSANREFLIGTGEHFFFAILLGTLFYFCSLNLLFLMIQHGGKKTLNLYFQAIFRVVLCLILFVFPACVLFALLTSEYAYVGIVAIFVFVPMVVLIFKSGILTSQ